MRHALLAALVLALPSAAAAEDFYVDPEAGSASGDGSAGAPWRTLEEVVAAGLIETRDWESRPPADGTALVPVNPGAPVGPGDTIWLRTGDHGALAIEGAYNAAAITIAAEEGHRPRLSSVLLRGASGWVLRGLWVSPSFAEPYDAQTMITIDDHDWRGPSHDVVVEGCTLFSVEDSSGWSAADWVANAASGITSDSDDVTIRDNTLTNVRFGISMSGDRAQVIGNSIRNFSGDGLRGLGDDALFEGNYVANCYDVDDNHDDGFQSWSVGPGGVGTGVVRNMTLRGNTIVNYEDPAQPLRGPLQGIGCFDGFFEGWVIENNVVVVDHWHGITLLGARDSRIVNNTVIDPNAERPGPPWIQFGDHKDGTASTGNLVRNNLATDLDSPAADTTEDHNLVIADRASLFVGPDYPYDLHLVEGGPAVDQGTAEQAPALDIEGYARPQGAAHDLGAYEWRAPGVEPAVDAGRPPPGGDAGPGVPAEDGGPGSSMDGGPGGSDDGGCGCRAVGVRPPRGLGLAVSFLALAWAARRRAMR